MFRALFESQVWQIVGWTMLHFLWTGSVIALLTAAVRGGLRAANPETRYAACLGSLGVLATLPVILAGALALRGLGYWPMPAIWMPAARVLPAVWFVGAPIALIVALTRLLGAERLRAQSRMVEYGPVTQICHRLLLALRVRRHVILAACEHVAAPVLVGIGRPMIVLPAVALTGWTPAQVEQVLAYQLVHLRRSDNLVNVLQRLVESALFFHPGVWLISHWVRVERQACCRRVVAACLRSQGALTASQRAAHASPSHAANAAADDSEWAQSITGGLRLRVSRRLVGALVTVVAAATLGICGYSYGARVVAARRLPPAPLAPLALGAEAPPVHPTAADVAIVRLVDAKGKPVSDAAVGFGAVWREDEYRMVGLDRHPLTLRSDVRGWVRVPVPADHESPTVLARQERRSLAATANWSGPHDTLVLEPVCRVRCHIASTGLEKLGHGVIWSRGAVRQKGGRRPIYERVRRTDHVYDYELPPGEYELVARAYGRGLTVAEQRVLPFHVDPGRSELDLGTIDLPPAPYAGRIGRAAPEFVGLHDSDTGKTLEVAALRGRWTLLAFLLDAPDVEQRMDLAGIAREYAPHNVAVLAIRAEASPDTQPDAAQTAPASGPAATAADTPVAYRVAMDQPGRFPIDGADRQTIGATAARYGVEAPGACLLVDPNGVLCSRVDLLSPAGWTRIDHAMRRRHPAPFVPPTQLRLHVVDEQGASITGARVGAFACGEYKHVSPEAVWQYSAADAMHDFRPTPLTGTDGRALLLGADLFGGATDNIGVPIYVVDESRHLAAISAVTQDDLGCEVPITLHPACRIDLAAHRDTAIDVRTHAMTPLRLRLGPAGRGELWLPPGTYDLCPDRATAAARTIDVPPNHATLEISF